jgi:predicted nucleic acid-binding protein
VSDFVLDASLTLQWFLEDEANRQYSLAVLASLSEKRALVPMLWFYEIGNGLMMAYRRKRITFDQIDGFLTRLKTLPIDAAQQTSSEILELPIVARAHGLTNYDAAYLALAVHFTLPLATNDSNLRKAAVQLASLSFRCKGEASNSLTHSFPARQERNERSCGLVGLRCGLLAGFVLAELQGKSLSTGVNCRKHSGAIRLGSSAVGIL